MDRSWLWHCGRCGGSRRSDSSSARRTKGNRLVPPGAGLTRSFPAFEKERGGSSSCLTAFLSTLSLSSIRAARNYRFRRGRCGRLGRTTAKVGHNHEPARVFGGCRGSVACLARFVVAARGRADAGVRLRPNALSFVALCMRGVRPYRGGCRGTPPGYRVDRR